MYRYFINYKDYLNNDKKSNIKYVLKKKSKKNLNTFHYIKPYENIGEDILEYNKRYTKRI